jgi:hypothetical protein
VAVFSFRAECQHDVTEFQKTLRNLNHVFQLTTHPLLLDIRNGKTLDIGELKVELEIDLTLIQVREIMFQQIDTHVMVESLRAVPLAENDLSRDRGVYQTRH